MNKLILLDTNITHYFVHYRHYITNPVIHYFLKTGNQSGFLIVLLFFLLAYHATLLQLSLLIIIIITLTLCLMLIKPIINRQRPFPEYAPSTHYFDNFSFPSGHATRIGAYYAFAVITFPPNWWFILLLIWGLLIAGSRIIMGVHYVSDVLGGLIIGFILGAFLMFLLQLFITYNNIH